MSKLSQSISQGLTSLAALALALLCSAFAGHARAAVQVLKVQDAAVTKSAASLSDAAGGAGVGVANQFCVVNTLGRGVRLTFSVRNAPSGINPSAQNPQTGTPISYRHSVALSDGSMAKVLQFVGGSDVFDVPATAVALSAAACPANGSVRQWITVNEPVPSNGIWTEQVTIKATPL